MRSTKIIKICSSSLCRPTCLHHMVILRTRNKITDFLMILAWASPFKQQIQPHPTLPSQVRPSDYQSAGSYGGFFLTCNSTLRLTCCSTSFHFCETTSYLTLRKGRYVILVAGPNTCAGHIKLSC